MSASAKKASNLSDILAGREPGETKRWRFVDEVPARGASFKKLQPDSDVAKQIASHLGLKSLDTVSPDGHVIIGFRERGWKRPLVMKDEEGEVKFVSETGAKRHFRSR